GKQSNESDCATLAKRLDSRAAGIAGGRYHDGAPFAASGKRVIHETAEELHRQIFECQRRTVEKFEQKGVDAELAQRRHGRMAKIAIGLAGKPREIAGRNRPAGKGPDDLDRNLRIGAAGETRDRRGIEARPSVRDIKAAIAAKAVEHGFGKAERGRLASGRDI